jgi:Tol biopolymer transport system component
VGGEIRKLQDATVTALSPDGLRIAFVKEQRVWQMASGGEDPAPLFSIPTGSKIAGLAWSPDGRWLTYLRRGEGPTGGAGLEARFAGGGGATTVFEDPNARAFCWLSSNQIVVDRWEAPDRPFSNLWAIAVDPATMKSRGKPRRLTTWAGFAIGGMSASRDGKRLAVTKRLDQSDVFVGDLAEHGDRLDHLRRVTSDERVDWPGGWGRDNKSLLIQSDRTAHMSIFKQAIDLEYPQPLVSNQDDNRAPLWSADGQWILYFAWPSSAARVKIGRLMRMPASGGSPELILETTGSPGSAQTSNRVLLPTTVGQPAFRCPSQTGSNCVLSESEPNEVAFQSFSPTPGAKKSELFRIHVKAPNAVAWDLSQDGSRIVYCERDVHSASIHVRELGKSTTRDILLPGWVELGSIAWSADGESLFVTNFAPAGSSLLHVTLDGRRRVLYTAAKEMEAPKPSPNGRFLAFGEVVSASNVWLIEGLPQ